MKKRVQWRVNEAVRGIVWWRVRGRVRWRVSESVRGRVIEKGRV